jgi:hypothetical protein
MSGGVGKKYSKRIELVILYPRHVVSIGMSQPQEIVAVCNTMSISILVHHSRPNKNSFHQIYNCHKYI